ncbi:hypothetical protein Syun_020392 [Stephania yunnanensis]|uniref:Cytochrome P450 n=1 Tax=Stephania yunnanensis TaxID=152371 RepID=A0AAP0IEE4_9MAGN
MQNNSHQLSYIVFSTMVSNALQKIWVEMQQEKIYSCMQQHWLSLLLFLLFILIVAIDKPRIIKIINLIRGNNNKSINLPPSPFKLPFIGNFHQLGSSPHRSLRALSLNHGPLMLLHLGQVPTLVVSSPDAAREVLKTHDHIFSSRPNSKIGNKFTYGKSLAFAPYGEYWRQIRKIYVLRLLNSITVRSFRAMREEETACLIETIERSSSSSVDNLVDLTEILFMYVNGIVCRATIGRKFSDEREFKRLRKMLDDMSHLSTISDVGNWIPWLSWVNYINGVNAMVEKKFEEGNEFLESIVEEHMEKKKKKKYDGETNGDEAENFVDVLLGLDYTDKHHIQLGRDHVKALILDMFAGGTETTHTVLTWAMAELVRQPNIMNRAQEEVRAISKGKQIVTEDDIEKMPYLHAVIKETLRLRPSGPLMVPHESTEHVKIHGYDIPAKTTVIVNMWAICRDPTAWVEPEKFDPDRFMDSKVDFKGQDFEYIPFGAGRRGCPGIAFAIASLELGLANLLNRFDWAMPFGMDPGELDMGETSGLTVHKKENLVLAAVPRQFDN